MTQSPTSGLNLADMNDGAAASMKDFWIACGHHLLDRNPSGGLVVTDEFLKAYFARPELMPPDDACAIERTIAPGAVRKSAPTGRRGRSCRDRRSRRPGELAIRAGIS